ncbi:MAG TPA: hypothetical protein VFV28_10415 [Limnobacter sp.]|nr:hypothetical protein [Limnobacter sp.]
MKSDSSIHQIVDQNNQAMMVLGGATAHSYRELGLGSSGRLLHPAVSILSISPQADAAGNTDTDSLSQESKPDLKSPDAFFPTVIGEDETMLLTDESLVASVLMPADLIQKALPQAPGFAASLPDGDPISSTSTGRVTGDQGLQSQAPDPSSLSSLSGAGFSLQDLLKQILQEVQTSQDDLPDTFDGSRQGALRDLIVDLGKGTGEGVREFFQENISGVARSTVVSLVDSADSPALSAASKPILQADYYNMISEPVNSMVDSVIQPIGSVSLPRLGPEFNRGLDELRLISG